MNLFEMAMASKMGGGTAIEMHQAVNEYSCKSYPHRAYVEGEWLSYSFGFATDKILSLEDLPNCEIEADYLYDWDGTVTSSTYSLKDATVTTVRGGYIIDVGGTPSARVIVVTDTAEFNRNCSCALESVGTYLGKTQYDTQIPSTDIRTVKLLRHHLPNKVINNKYLDLENHPVIKDILLRL